MSIPSDRYRRWERRARARDRSSLVAHDGDTPFDRLHDDLLVEIISHVPSRERWLCKRVCRRWLRLARTLPQSLAGFFYTSTSKERFPESALHFFNASGDRRRPFIYPSFAFLPSRRRLDLLDCCNGLVLCRWYAVSAADDDDGFRYVVCNPATEEWLMLPEPEPDHSQSIKIYSVHLGFDPTTSFHFHVFVLLLQCGGHSLPGVAVYSSETRTWVVHTVMMRLGDDVTLFKYLKSTVFLNGCLHFHTLDYRVYDSSGPGSYRVERPVPSIAAVNTHGETWTDFRFPIDLEYGPSVEDDGFIQLSQGRLHYANYTHKGDRLLVYVLEDYDNRQWILKHTIQMSDVFSEFDSHRPVIRDYRGGFNWVAIDLERNMIFFTLCWHKIWNCQLFMWYSMDSGQTREMRTLEDGRSPCLPYAPFYSELQCFRLV